MQRPLVTVYITNYNYGNYIKEAIESVLSQTYSNIELIIIDDGSKDNSKSSIEKYRYFPAIQIIYQKNVGLNKTNNIALSKAKGKYIIRLDADDYFHPDAIFSMVEILEKNDEIGLVFPDYYLIDRESNVYAKHTRHNFEQDVELLDQPAHGACTLIRIKFLKDLNGYNENYKCQDGYDLWVKFISNYKVANLNRPLFYYRRHGENLTSNEIKILNTRMAIHKEHFAQRFSPIPALAVIPCRGNTINLQSQLLNKLNGKTLLDIKVEHALQSRHIDKVVVTSSDKYIEKAIRKTYKDNKQVVFISRPISTSDYSKSLVFTILNIIRKTSDEYKYLVTLAPEFPYLDHFHIDDAIHSLSIFKADSLISVREESETFFQHKGKGMEPILDHQKFNRYERETLYKHIGGITVSHTEKLKQNKKIIIGNVGHISLDNISSISVNNSNDLIIAKAFNPIYQQKNEDLKKLFSLTQNN